MVVRDVALLFKRDSSNLGSRGQQIPRHTDAAERCWRARCLARCPADVYHEVQRSALSFIPTCKPLGRLADWTHSRYILSWFAEHRPGSILYIVACRLPPGPTSRDSETMATHPAPSAKCQAPCSLTWPPFAVLHLSAPRIRSPRHSPVEWALGQFPGSSGWLTKLARRSHSAGTPT